jgi:cytochrome d ubiquinol oxidase subunit II
VGLALLAVATAFSRLRAGREGQAFAALGLTIAATVITLFGALYPDILPSTLDESWSLSVAATASSPYALGVMTWVAVFALPGVLIYQGWTYWVFRKRLSTRQIPHVPH